jgi:BirA family biotin operon repressor/biotin-[acetyl-CoA-carboxylase] ligase
MQHDFLTPDAILHNLGTKEIPRQVICYTLVSSTMDIARGQARKWPAEIFPVLVLAEEQTAGRGRMQRPWLGSPGEALLFSLAMRNLRGLPPTKAHMLIWMAGVSVCEGIAAVTPLQPRLKWPNDVLLPLGNQSTTPGSMGKVAGILLESSSSQEQVNWAVIGCGLNVNDSPPVETQMLYPAMSLASALGQSVPRLPLLQAILQRMDFWYTCIQAGQHDALFEVWRDLLVTLGQQVRIQTDHGILAGMAETVDPSGALYVRDEAGTLHSITNGDVSG